MCAIHMTNVEYVEAVVIPVEDVMVMVANMTPAEYAEETIRPALVCGIMASM